MDLKTIQQHSSSSPLQIMAASKTVLDPNHKRKAGRKIFKETRHPVYRGVRRKKGGKWVLEPNKKSRIWLGTSPDPETTEVAQDVALRGDDAPLNFPDSVTCSQANKEFEICGHVEITCDPRESDNINVVEFVDEEAMFNMPVLLDSMAEGMLLTPLAMMKGFNGDQYDHVLDFNLWSN